MDKNIKQKWLVMGYGFKKDPAFTFAQNLVINGWVTTECTNLPIDIAEKAGLSEKLLETLTEINDTSHGFAKVIKFIEEKL